MAKAFAFKSVETKRDSLVAKQQREIKKLYANWAKEIGRKANVYAASKNASAPIKAAQLRDLKQMLKATSMQITNEVKDKISENIFIVADETVKASNSQLEKLGVFNDSNGKLIGAMSNVPRVIVGRIVNGEVYEGGFSLNKSIWSDQRDTHSKLYQIIAEGVAKNEPTYDIAKKLEKYVNPSAAKQWNLKSSDGKRIYPKQVDYNAQRLARTLTQHAYQQSFIETTKDNPLIEAYEWIANGSRVCPICRARNGRRYKKNELPMDHPNGMCSFNIVEVQNIEQKLNEWVNAPEGTYEDLDNFDALLNGAERRVKAAQTKQVEKFVGKYMTKGEMLDDSYAKLSLYSRQEVAALEEYGKGGYFQMNNVLRGNETIFLSQYESIDAVKADIRLVNEALQKTKTSSDLLVRRILDLKDVEQVFGVGIDKLNAGAKIKFQGFLSTTAVDDTSVGFQPQRAIQFVIEFQVPAGTNAINMYNPKIAKHYLDEGELLLGHNTKASIVEVIRETGKPLKVVMRIEGESEDIP